MFLAAASSSRELLTNASPQRSMDFTCPGMMAVGKRKRNDPAAPYFSDDLVIEILSRLPERPLRRFKCVSRTWRDLISGPIHRRRLARTDAASGLFYHAHAGGSWATSLSFAALLCPPDGRGGGGCLEQAFPFLPWGTQVKLLDSCNGLLLLRCCYDDVAAARYIVCDPGTHGWAVELPVPPPEPIRQPDPIELRLQAEMYRRGERPLLEQQWRKSRHPDVSSHFHVFEMVEDGGGGAIKAVQIYSSETGEWVRKDSAWSYHVTYAGENAYFSSDWSYRLAYAGSHAYLNGFLHLTTTDSEKGGVGGGGGGHHGQDVEAMCPATLGAPGVIAQSQHRLLYVDAGGPGNGHELSVYALEKCGGGGGERWSLKHRSRSLEPSGHMWMWWGKRYHYHSVVAIHPDCNVIFLFDRPRQSLIAYDMDSETTRVVHTFTDAPSNCRFSPYVPLYLQ